MENVKGDKRKLIMTNEGGRKAADILNEQNPKSCDTQGVHKEKPKPRHMPIHGLRNV